MNLYVLYTSLLYLLNLALQCAGDEASGITYCYQCGDSDLTDRIFDSPKFENLYVNTFLELQPCEMDEKYVQCEGALYCSTVFVKQEGSKKVRVAFKGCSDTKIDRKLNTKDGLSFDMITCGSRFCNGPRDSALSNHVSIYLLVAIILNHFLINKRVLL